jgi:hypothetical protein
MRFYRILSDYYVDDNGVMYFATLATAEKAAREIAVDTGRACEVERVEMNTDRATIIALANDRSWCSGSFVVYTAHPGRVR